MTETEKLNAAREQIAELADIVAELIERVYTRRPADDRRLEKLLDRANAVKDNARTE